MWKTAINEQQSNCSCYVIDFDFQYDEILIEYFPSIKAMSSGEFVIISINEICNSISCTINVIKFKAMLFAMWTCVWIFLLLFLLCFCSYVPFYNWCCMYVFKTEFSNIPMIYAWSLSLSSFSFNCRSFSLCIRIVYSNWQIEKRCSNF